MRRQNNGYLTFLHRSDSALWPVTNYTARSVCERLSWAVITRNHGGGESNLRPDAP